jgi:gag-polypeptide of LTR copia-type
MIVTSVPNSVFNCIKASANVKAVWELLKKVFEGYTRSLLINLGKKLQNTKCGEDNNI